MSSKNTSVIAQIFLKVVVLKKKRYVSLEVVQDLKGNANGSSKITLLEPARMPQDLGFHLISHGHTCIKILCFALKHATNTQRELKTLEMPNHKSRWRFTHCSKVTDCFSKSNAKVLCFAIKHAMNKWN